MKKYEPHPLAQIVPPMAPEEYQELKADIKQHGQEQPIALYEEKILDGVHRARACAELKIEVETFEWKSRAGHTPTQYVLSMNGHRRHLSPGQKAALALELAKEMRKRFPAKTGSGGDVAAIAKELGSDTSIRLDPETEVMEIVAPAVGASFGTAKEVVALANEAPDLYEEVRAGTMNVSEATRERKKRKPKPRQSPEQLTATMAKTTLKAAKSFADAVTKLSMRPSKPDDHTLLLIYGWIITAGDAWKAIIGRRELSAGEARKAIES